MLLDFNNLIKKYNLNIKGVIHIGAHYGEEYSLYKQNNIDNLIFFEPLQKNFNILKQKINDEKSILVNKALGNNNCIIKMNVEENNLGQSSSILNPKIHLIQYPKIKFNTVEEVSMITLDSFFLDNDSSTFNMINIDVQGYELEVFKGAAKTLNHIDYIISEINRAELYENCCSYIELDEYLENYNFVRVETNWEGITWGDALYIKKN